MTTSIAPSEAKGSSTPPAAVMSPARFASIDALRGLVMFTMIFVNDLAGAPRELTPDWMVHFSDRHRGGSGMTFVDLVFPAFLFIVGMSIPFALGSRLAKGLPLWKTILHVLTRTLALLAIGILMVSGESAARQAPHWSPTWWHATMFLSAIFAFCTITPSGSETSRAAFWRVFQRCLRSIGFAGLIYCAFSFHGRRGQPIVSLSPFVIHTSWYGILGLIGWAYLVGSLAYLAFRSNRTALLGCAALLLCLYPADKHGLFDGSWISRFVGVGEILGAHPFITVAGVLLGAFLSDPKPRSIWALTRFTLLFSGGCAIAAVLLNGLYGISKNNATPSWCLWACAITAALWWLFYLICDVRPVRFISRPLAIAGQNVLLAYLLSEMLESVFSLLHLGGWYDSLSEGSLAGAIARSAGCGVVLLCLTAAFNRIGFRLKL